MLRKLVIAVVVLAIIAAAVLWMLTIPMTMPAEALGPHTPDLDKGKTMFWAGGCPSCHATPQQEDKTRLGGGLALKSPFGTFYAPNISSDRSDGIGGWDDAQFVNAMTRGTVDGSFRRTIAILRRGAVFGIDRTQITKHQQQLFIERHQLDGSAYT